jgi:energy-coupling factor transport system permease protein
VIGEPVTGTALPPAATWLSRANPAAKLIAALLVAVGLLPAVDPVTGGLVLAVELAIIPASGLPARTLIRLGAPLFLASLSIGFVNGVFGTEGMEGGLGVAIRLPAIALPGILAAATTDPTELADALVQRLRLPERPAISALAALRLLPMLTAEWQALRLARRARGLDARGNPVRALALFTSATFALLVRAIRAGTRLATAMDARGFGTGPRTHARTSALTWRDPALVGCAAALVIAAHAVSLAIGTWRPLL